MAEHTRRGIGLEFENSKMKTQFGIKNKRRSIRRETTNVYCI